MAVTAFMQAKCFDHKLSTAKATFVGAWLTTDIIRYSGITIMVSS